MGKVCIIFEFYIIKIKCNYTFPFNLFKIIFYINELIMRKIAFLIMFFMSMTLYAQNESELSKTDNSNESGIYLSFTSLNNFQNTTDMLGWGFRFDDKIKSRFFGIEFLFPIKNKDIDFVIASNVYAGIPMVSLKLAKKLEIGLNGEIGLSNFIINDSLKNQKVYTGFNGSFGINVRFYGFILNCKIGPIFTTGTYKFNSFNISLGYIF